MAIQFQHLRGITTKVSSYVGLPGEIVVDLTAKQLCLHDGSTVGGVRVAKDEVVTASSRGLMSAADKQQLTNLAAQVATLVEASQTPVADIQAGKDASGNTITTTYATKDELASAKQGLVQIVTSLPASGVEGVIYLIETTAGSQTFNEYVWENNTFVPFGISKLDLSDYSKKSDTIKQLSISGKTITYTKGDNTTGTLTTQDTTYSVMGAATASAAGTAGLVPAPAAGKQTSFLRGDGTWVVPTNTTYTTFVKSGTGAAAGLVPAPSTTAGTTKYLREDGTWQVPPDTNTTYTLSSLGIGNVKNYDQSKAIKAITRSGTTFTYTCLDGTTGTFTQQDNNTTYGAMGAATASAAGTAGLVPAPAAGKQTSFLRGDGTWVVPTNTTYGAASTTANGLVTTAAQTWAGAKAFTGGVNLYKSSLRMTVNKGSANTTDYAVDVLKALGDNAGYGLNLALGGSGNTIVGGGESSASQLNDLKDNSGENLYLTADSVIYLKTNCNTWANAKTVTLDTSANLSGLANVTATKFIGALQGNVTGNCSGSSGSCTGNAATATKIHRVPSGESYVSAVTAGNALINSTATNFGALWNAPTKNYRVGCATYPYSNDDVYICYSVTNANVTAGTNTTAKTLIWNANTGVLNASGGFGGTATKATQDSAGQQINTTYIKGLSVSGRTITYTKGDGTTGTITTQDTNTTYSVATTSANGLMSKTDKANLDNLVSQMATLVTQMETLSDKVNTLLAKMDTYYTGYTGYPRS